MHMHQSWRFAFVLLLIACASAPPSPQPEPQPAVSRLPEGVEATSFLGTPLMRQQLPAEVLAAREKDLVVARGEYELHPDSADAIIWVGRRLAYLGRFREAIDAFSEGIRKHPNDARLYRHRGHRYITVRELDNAVRDLEKAQALTKGKRDEVEPDGQPNARNTPIGSLQSNICYHLGLAYYLKGDFERALPVYRRCYSSASNADRQVSVGHWLYMTLRRLGRAEEAQKIVEPISSSMDVIENVSYHKLMLAYGGDIAPDELMNDELQGNDRATILYGVGNWYLYNGRPDRAREIFRSIVEKDPWPAFGYIAAEAELARR